MTAPLRKPRRDLECLLDRLAPVPGHVREVNACTTKTDERCWYGCGLVSPSKLGLAQGLAPARPQEVALSPERLERLTDAFRGYVENGKLAGAVVLVARRGKVAYLQPFGWSDKESRTSMRQDGIFRIASQTKPIISVAVMMLQEQGALLISDPVGKYLPEFRKTTVAVPKDGNGYDVVQAKRPITIRDLLTHTAGIGYGSGTAKERWGEAKIQGWYFADRDEPIGATISRLASLPFDAQPGERWVYGYATDILGALVERSFRGIARGVSPHTDFPTAGDAGYAFLSAGGQARPTGCCLFID